MPKRKTGMRKPGAGNPNPVMTPEFEAKKIKPIGEIFGDQPLSSRITSVRLPVDVEQAISALPQAEKVTWLRKTLVAAARAELMKPVVNN